MLKRLATGGNTHERENAEWAWLNDAKGDFGQEIVHLGGSKV